MYQASKPGLKSSTPQYLDDELQSIYNILNQLTSGITYVQAQAGVPSFTPTLVTGRVPLVYDTTGNILYVYSGGSWHAT